MARLTNPIETNSILCCIPRFLAVGMLGTLVDVGLFTILHILWGMPALAANTISSSAGIVNNFVLHRHWTFANRQRLAAGAQFSQFALVSLSALMINKQTLRYLRTWSRIECK